MKQPQQLLPYELIVRIQARTNKTKQLPQNIQLQGKPIKLWATLGVQSDKNKKSR